MAFNFELTISGLCVIVLKAEPNDKRPTKPKVVDVLCVAGYSHKPRLTYPPDLVFPKNRLDPELCVDSKGQRAASLDLRNLAMTLVFKKNPPSEFSLTWGDDKKPAPTLGTAEESWIQWVPSPADIGLDGIRLASTAEPKKLVHGVSARLRLPPGKLSARSIVKKIKQKPEDEDEASIWKFAKNERALANEIVYSAEGVDDLEIAWGPNQLNCTGDRALKMCISNDLEYVPLNFADENTALHHMGHLLDLAEPLKPVIVPKIKADQRTGHLVCNQVVFVDDKP